MNIYDIILYEENEETGEQKFYSYEGDCSFMFDDIVAEDCIEIDNPEHCRRTEDHEVEKR